MNFSLLQNVRIVEGPGCVAKVGEILKEAGYSKAFLVFDCGVKAAGIVDKVVAALDSAGVAHVLFDRVLPDPPADIVDEGAEHCRREGCDCVVGLGGGSSIDTAKGINLLRFNDGNILSYASPDTPMKRSPGLLSIPTTAGTGSELSNGLIISNPGEGVKVPILAVNAMSEYAVIDPELTLGMPPGLTIATGLDVFSHACEGYTSILANAMTDMLCEKIMENVAAYLPAAHRDGSSLEARERMLVSASLGGWMLAQASAHVGHSLAHVVGGRLHIPHGLACAYSLPVTLELIAPAVPSKVRKVGVILGAQFSGSETLEEIGRKAADAHRHFTFEVLGVKKLGGHDVDLDMLAGEVENEVLAGLSPVKVTHENALEMLKRMFA